MSSSETATAMVPVGEERAIARQPAPVTMFDAHDPIALYMNTSVFEQLQRVGKLMCNSELVPAHLRGKQSDCFLVAAQAFRWGMDPFAVAQHTFVTSGKLGYEGKLIAAVINASSKLKGSLRYEHVGPKGSAERRVIVRGRLRGEDEDREIDGSVKDWKTQNKFWESMPDQMLCYRGAREWARRHMPEAVLGIQADEELPSHEQDRLPVRDVTPPKPAADRAAATADPLLAAVVTAVATEVLERAPEPDPVKEEEQIEAGPACDHSPVQKHRERVARSVITVCSGCGEELAGLMREPGDDDDEVDPQARLAVEQIARAATAAPPKRR